MLEIPGQGWPDLALKEALGPANPELYVRQMCKDLDYVAAKQLTWSCVQHDWSAIEGDPQMRSTRAILEHARKLGFQAQTHRAFCEDFNLPEGIAHVEAQKKV